MDELQALYKKIPGVWSVGRTRYTNELDVMYSDRFPNPPVLHGEKTKFKDIHVNFIPVEADNIERMDREQRTRTQFLCHMAALQRQKDQDEKLVEKDVQQEALQQEFDIVTRQGRLGYTE